MDEKVTAVVDPETERLADPTEAIPKTKRTEGIALCLSGGGYRAMIFHVGVLWRLNEAGYLPRLKRVSSVSGGSITAGVLALQWPNLQFDASGVARQFQELVVEPLRSMASTPVDIRAGVARLVGILLPFTTIGDHVERAYRRHLFGDATLQDLPDTPRFVINATNLQSGVLWRFMKPYMADYRVGMVRQPKLPLARAVAASSAFPPFLSPVRLKLKHSDFAPGNGQDLEREPFTTRVVLTDGGVYDNLGLEPAKQFQTILVSDGGGKYESQPKPWRDWLCQLRRVLDTIDNQVRSLRKRHFIDAIQCKIHDGAYWGIRTNIDDYHAAVRIPCPIERTLALADTPTRLARMAEVRQERLINWGYAVCDAAMRAYVDAALPDPKGLPYPGSGV